MKIDILVLNYNGKDLMEAYLPSVCEAAERSAHECEVHVVDNLSSDGSARVVREGFPAVRLHIARENRVLCSYNEVVRDLSSDVVIFLNNDIKVEPDFVDILVGHFEKEDVMFAAPRLMNFDGTYNGGRSFLKFDKGAVKVMVDEDNFKRPGGTCAISTGAFRRSAFLDLGGFDDLYLPGIWEDVDICFRGQILGWKGVYEPDSVIWHDESTTFHREYGKKGKMRIAHRNMFLFFWKNITDPGMFAGHLVWTVPRAAVLALKGKTEIMEGLLMAIRRMPLVIGKRKHLKKESRIKRDRDLIG